MSGKRVLITGGAGFVGSHLADRLIARGDQVLVIDTFETGRRDNLRPHANLRVVEGDIRDQALMSRIFDEFKPQVVAHAAASYKDPENHLGDVSTNVTGTAIIVNNAKRHNVSRFIYFQTALCYGDPKVTPVPLDHPINPGKSSYAISKTAGEQYIQLSGLNYVSFRLANAYGPRNLSGPLPTFYMRLMEKKPIYLSDTRRDFVFIKDMVDVIEKAVDGVGASGVYHLSSGKDSAIQELFDATVDVMGIKLDGPVPVKPRGPDDVFTMLLDPSKTLKEFGILPSTPLREGIHSAISYYKEYGVSETYTHLKFDKK